MKTFKCPSCGGNLPDPGTGARIECRYCGSLVDVQPDATGEVRIKAWSKVAISKKWGYENKGKYHSVKSSASLYAGASSVSIEARGPLAEARVEMPGDGPGSIYVRGGSSTQAGSFSVDQPTVDDGSVGSFDEAGEPSPWVDSIVTELSQLASRMGVSLTMLAIAGLLVLCLCSTVTVLAASLLLSP